MIVLWRNQCVLGAELENHQPGESGGEYRPRDGSCGQGVRLVPFLLVSFVCRALQI